MDTNPAFPNEGVSVLSKCFLQRAHQLIIPPPQSPFKLGPFDQLGPPMIPIAIVNAYKHPNASQESTPEHNDFLNLPRLHLAIQRLLDYYPHLTGRLHFNPTDGTPEINRVDTGVEVISAHSNLTIHDLTDSQTGRVLVTHLPGSGSLLIPPFTSTLEAVCKHSILTIQHTRFACGSVALGFRVHHIVTDAEGFFQLIANLAELYRGLCEPDANVDTVQLSHPPHITSYLSDVHMSESDRKAAQSFEPSLFTLGPSHGGATAGAEEITSYLDDPTGPRVTGRVHRFSGAELAVLKQKAVDPNGAGWTSTFSALSAHLLQRVYQARVKLHQIPSLPRGFLTTINLRPGNRLGLPSHYAPNAILSTHTTFPHPFLLSSPLYTLASQIHTLTHSPSLSTSQIEKTAKWIAAQEDKRRIRPALLESIGGGGGVFMVTQWNRFDMYGSVFDGERPVLSTAPWTRISLVDGFAFFLGTGEEEGEEGGVDVNLALGEEVWEGFEWGV
ncbi:hypothetical protein M011DRAFT_446169 [Sporormia fimetaria CBS 119925]|uniref:Transferase family protein n=1 Tax=Sporormia fimetaria CBS 119925 TaxID=1340428 RepID=A0A6A6V888_9PLEO|nr:hypothetical protein M011DRAFT_446169 [Sporormia fimetaria CBS 119925]